jgi:hypothetical protein
MAARPPPAAPTTTTSPTPPVQTPPRAVPDETAVAAARGDGEESTVFDTVTDSSFERFASRDSANDASASSPSSISSENDEIDERDFVDARFNSKLIAEEEEDAQPLAAVPESPPEPATVQSLEVARVPAFISAADRRARWRRREVRLALGGVALALASLLVVQVALQFRDGIAARWPGTVPVLRAMCDWADCRIAAPRQLGAISVDSSGLTQIEGGGAYQLSVVLRNRASHVIAQPAIELSLTDSAGRVLVRRVLQPRDFAFGAPATLPPLSETPLQMTLTAGSERVSGYLIETFYP